MNGTDVELRKELWMWRGIGILLLLMLLLITAITFIIDRNQHAKDNAERAATWQELKGGLIANRAMIMKNYDAILKNSEEAHDLRAEIQRCAACHGHKHGTPLAQRRPVN